MDLKELHTCHTVRHPWETSRLKALQSILTPETFEGIKVLDVGCGDGFICGSLFGHLSRKEITAVDINLTDEMLGGLGTNTQGIRCQREMPADGDYDLVLLLDLLEHIASDKEFLADLADNYLSENGKVMIITNAADGWVELSAQRFLPNTFEVLRADIEIVSARSKFERELPG